MLKSKLSRLALVGAGAAALMVTMAPSAQAVTDKTIKLPHDRGYMKFIDDGDVFKVCDTKADGYGVTGTLFVRNASGLVSVAATIDDGGDEGCDKQGYNIGQLASYQMRVCWDGGGCVSSEWFNE
ncbi:hypothetical protein JCM4814A_21320 [Streptomyces phaeofaciens JCM 4814]|uniref:Secreted protein n=1 Tax=Streptomyces phaeofaciens TaxID=68254 RepID=A0A918HQK2_9ACTN|nr:hypothetical protein [Streptomyces phaeofaciens]GGT94925.1 hypothetical protein GCM10010226_85830 [Streptomyces phaeofaciens]